MSDYIKKIFEINDEVTHEDLNHIQTQYEKGKNGLIEHEMKANGIHGLTANQYIVKTKNLNQYPDWSEIQNKPQIPTNQAIQNIQNKVDNLENRVEALEKGGGSGGNGGGGGLTEQEVQNIAANVKASSQYAVVIRRNPSNPLEGEIYWVD